MGATVFIILQIFFCNTRSFQIFPSFSWGIFGHVTRLAQSRASENIWWIIMMILQAPSKASTFVSSVLKPVREFMEDNQTLVKQQQRQAWAAAILQTLLVKWVLCMVNDTWRIKVLGKRVMEIPWYSAGYRFYEVIAERSHKERELCLKFFKFF